jgi:hypothetical protein
MEASLIQTDNQGATILLPFSRRDIRCPPNTLGNLSKCFTQNMKHTNIIYKMNLMASLTQGCIYIEKKVEGCPRTFQSQNG